MGQRDRYDTYWGPKKYFFLIRDIDGRAMTAASMESSQFVVQRSPWGQSGSGLIMCNRLRRMRGRFYRYIYMGNSLSQPSGQSPSPQVFDLELSGEPPPLAHAA